MKIFITGGTGFIGSHLIDSLLQDKGMEIYALVRDLHNKKWLEGRAIHCLEGNLEDLPSLPQDLEIIYHIAGSTKPRNSADYYTVNQEGSASFFQALAERDIRPKKLVLLSSLAAAGPSQAQQPVRESDPPRPITPYGRSKLAGEQEALKFKNRFPLVIIRVGAVFGPRDRDFLSLFRLIKKGIMPSFGPSHALISLCYVQDLVNGLKHLMQADTQSGDIFNIGDPTPYSWKEFARITGRILGKTPHSIRIPIPLAYLVAFAAEIGVKLTGKPNILNRDKIKDARQDAWVADMDLAQNILGFKTRYSLEAGLKETLAWYQEQGWL